MVAPSRLAPAEEPPDRTGRARNPYPRTTAWLARGVPSDVNPHTLHSRLTRSFGELVGVQLGVGGAIRTRRPRSCSGPSWRWRGEQPGEGSCARRPNQRTFTPSTSATRKSGSPVSTGQSSTNPAPSASSVSSKMQHFLSAASSPCNDPLEFAAPDHCLRNPLSRLERRHGHRLSTGNSRGGSWCRRSRSDHRVAVRAHAGPRHGRRPC